MATNISSYNVTPTPMYGTGGSAYGAAPGVIGLPPSMYEQTESIYPDLGLQAQIAGRNIGAGLMGEVSPQTLFQLQQNAARFGQSSGMPGSGLNTNMGLLSLGQNVEARQSQALGEYQNLAKTLGSMQTPQELASGIATWNATNLAAPSPEAAAKQQMSDWMRQFNMTKAAGKGGGGATSVSMPQGGAPQSMSQGYGSMYSPSAMKATYDETDRARAWEAANTFNPTLPWTGGVGSVASQSDIPANTVYNPNTDTYDYTGGLPSWYPQAGTEGYQPTSSGSMYMGNAQDY